MAALLYHQLPDLKIRPKISYFVEGMGGNSRLLGRCHYGGIWLIFGCQRASRELWPSTLFAPNCWVDPVSGDLTDKYLSCFVFWPAFREWSIRIVRQLHCTLPTCDWCNLPQTVSSLSPCPAWAADLCFPPPSNHPELKHFGYMKTCSSPGKPPWNLCPNFRFSRWVVLNEKEI